MIDDVEDYFARGCGRCGRFGTTECSARRWANGLAVLRRICVETGLAETVKWGHPCYMHADRNIAIIGAFRDDFRLTFFEAALLRDPDGALEPRGPSTRQPDVLRFRDGTRVAEMEPTVRQLLRQAMDNAQAGIRAPKVVAELELPAELVEALDCDPELAEAFHHLTPGRKRSYVVNLGSARTTTTRVARIARFRSRIIAGKGANER